MKLIKHKDGKFSLAGMTKEEVSVIRSLVGITSEFLDKEEASIYEAVSEFPKIHYVNTGAQHLVLSRKETK